MSRGFVVVLLEIVFVGWALVWRSVQHRRTTGSAGFVALRERGVPARLAGLSMIAGVFGLATGTGVAADSQAWTVVAGAGAALMTAGLALTVAAQQQMGPSWRIGVDPAERTELVTAGLFGRVRNPIFTAMILFAFGVALAMPNAWSVVGAALLAAGIMLQVLVVEEPYLRRVHGEAYERYVRGAGRFLPRLG